MDCVSICAPVIVYAEMVTARNKIPNDVVVVAAMETDRDVEQVNGSENCEHDCEQAEHRQQEHHITSRRCQRRVNDRSGLFETGCG